MTQLLPPAEVQPLSVSEVTNAVKALLEKSFSSLWIAGEISGMARPNSGHLYFKLKDAGATLNSVIWRGVAMRLRFDPRDGMEVIARGRLSVYPPRGEYQLSIEEIHPKGIGALDLALRQLKEKLSARGYFDPRRKKPLPRFPRKLALVTSPSGAAVRDMLEVLAKRWPVAEILICPVRVQGEGAALEIAGAIRLLNQLCDQGKLQVDAMVVGRGGGSIEDLWAFNEEPVAEAIFASRIPIVSAVGHEIDVTIADLVADHRGLTPSHAAADVTPDVGELLINLRDARRRADEAMRRRLELAKQRVEALTSRPAFRRPVERIRDHERRLDELGERLRRAVKLKCERLTERVVAAAGRLESLSPLNVLARGYSLTRTEHGPALLRDASRVAVGERLVTTLHQGQIVSRVEQIRPS